MQRTCTILIVAVALVVVGAGWGEREPVARLLEVKGTAEIVEAESLQRPAAVYGTVYADERLIVDKDAQVTLVFRDDGHIERIAAPGAYHVTKNGCQPKQGIEQVAMPAQSRATIGKISKGPRGIVQGGVIMARSMAPPSSQNADSSSELTETPPPVEPLPLADPAKIRPLPDTSVLSTKPTFSWPDVPNATNYSLRLYFLGNRIWSADSEAAHIEYTGEDPLKPAAMYWWAVTTTIDGKTVPVCEGSFHMASDYQRGNAVALEKVLAKPDPLSLAVAALWYKQNAFVPEAIAANEQLVKLAPSAAVYRELAELYFEAGREEDGAAAETKALELEQKAEGGGRRAE